MDKNFIKLLKEIIETPSISGYSAEITDYLRKKLTKINGLEISEFKRGGVLVKIVGKSSSKKGILLSAHCDTLGAMVKDIFPDGTIKFTNVGGFSPLTVLGNYCTIISRDKRYTGTVIFKESSVHAVGRDFEKGEFDEDSIIIRLDEVVSKKEDIQKLGISVGDYISWDTSFEHTKSGFIKSRHLDDKLGVAILLRFLEEKKQFNNDIYILFSVLEEVGFGANMRLPETIEYAIVVDNGVMGKGQQTKEDSVTICAKDAASPFNYELRLIAEDVAKKNKIPYVVDIYPHYGSDLAAALRAGNDFKALLISPGVHASHSWERTHINSIKATYNLLNSLVEKLDSM
ncbi:M42 family metallopeptidase [bacterium]|nr:M42 family metallopeptidase [bacterium]